jgi:hypothetical protein
MKVIDFYLIPRLLGYHEMPEYIKMNGFRQATLSIFLVIFNFCLLIPGIFFSRSYSCGLSSSSCLMAGGLF